MGKEFGVMDKKLSLHKKLLFSKAGLSLIEIIIALFIVVIISTFALRAYLSAHKVEGVQASISDTQQNARASLNLLTDLFKVAGSFLPAGLRGIEGTNTNPDTVIIRFTNQSGTP